MTTNRLCTVIPVADQPRLVEELAAVERALAGDFSIDFYPHAAVGKRCRVKAGPCRASSAPSSSATSSPAWSCKSACSARAQPSRSTPHLLEAEE